MKVLAAQSQSDSAIPWTSPPGSSVSWILQGKNTEEVAIPFSRGSFCLGDQIQVSGTAGTSLTI